MSSIGMKTEGNLSSCGVLVDRTKKVEKGIKRESLEATVTTEGLNGMVSDPARLTKGLQRSEDLSKRRVLSRVDEQTARVFQSLYNNEYTEESTGARTIRQSGGKDRHSKVFTSKGPRDRRVRLSVSTAIQFYDVQDRLGYDQPSKAVEWLIKQAKPAIDELQSLPELGMQRLGSRAGRDATASFRTLEEPISARALGLTSGCGRCSIKSSCACSSRRGSMDARKVSILSMPNTQDTGEAQQLEQHEQQQQPVIMQQGSGSESSLILNEADIMECATVTPHQQQHTKSEEALSASHPANYFQISQEEPLAFSSISSSNLQLQQKSHMPERCFADSSPFGMCSQDWPQYRLNHHTRPFTTVSPFHIHPPGPAAANASEQVPELHVRSPSSLLQSSRLRHPSHVNEGCVTVIETSNKCSAVESSSTASDAVARRVIVRDQGLCNQFLLQSLTTLSPEHMYEYFGCQIFPNCSTNDFEKSISIRNTTYESPLLGVSRITVPDRKLEDEGFSAARTRLRNAGPPSDSYSSSAASATAGQSNGSIRARDPASVPYRCYRGVPARIHGFEVFEDEQHEHLQVNLRMPISMRQDPA